MNLLNDRVLFLASQTRARVILQLSFERLSILAHLPNSCFLKDRIYPSVEYPFLYLVKFNVYQWPLISRWWWAQTLDFEPILCTRLPIRLTLMLAHDRYYVANGQERECIGDLGHLFRDLKVTLLTLYLMQRPMPFECSLVLTWIPSLRHSRESDCQYRSSSRLLGLISPRFWPIFALKLALFALLNWEWNVLRRASSLMSITKPFRHSTKNFCWSFLPIWRIPKPLHYFLFCWWIIFVGSRSTNVLTSRSRLPEPVLEEVRSKTAELYEHALDPLEVIKVVKDATGGTIDIEGYLASIQLSFVVLTGFLRCLMGQKIVRVLISRRPIMVWTNHYLIQISTPFPLVQSWSHFSPWSVMDVIASDPRLSVGMSLQSSILSP